MNHSIITQVSQFCARQGILSQRSKALVTLSGGADSVCLLRILLQMGVPLVAAHCNFHLRGDESNRDERFVTNLCARLGVELYVKHFDVPAEMNRTGASVEMACRTLRYAWFEQLRCELDCDVIAVAHHLDDSIETFWLNALRGTGIAGLAGIRAVNGHIVRPLLCLHRSDILRFLQIIGQDYVTDSTNLQTDALRNRLRNTILPAVYHDFPNARTTLARTLEHTAQCYLLYVEAVGIMRERVAPGYSLDDSFEIIGSQLLKVKNAVTLLFEMLQPLGFNYSNCQQAFEALKNNDGAEREFRSAHRILTVKNGNMAVALIEEQDTNEYEFKIAHGLKLNNPVAMTIVLGDQPFNPRKFNGKTTIALDASVARCRRIVLRHWRQCDRIKPFGMSGSRLLSDVFSDLHLTTAAKRGVWLLEADGRILWILGVRASAHFAVKPGNPYFVLSI